MPAPETVTLIVLAVLGAFGLSATQAAIAAHAGSDHPVHAFLRDGIRGNGGRLFITVPRLLNVAHCAALPLYLHWIMARLPIGAIPWSERLLNPIVNAVHVLLVAAIATTIAVSAGTDPALGAWTALLFALTPQFFHALSARNFGLSARGTGLVLLTLFFAATHYVEVDDTSWVAWLLAAMCGWLIWGFSTFAQQALVITSALLLLGGRWQPALGALLGLVLFVALHPRYASSYLRHTLRFLQAYASELAPIYVLQRRPGVWRDWVWDIWRKPREIGCPRAVLYAYENPVLVVVLTNPLTLVAVLATSAGHVAAPGYSFGGAVALAGLAAALLTSLRATRFLGEPERYVEAVTPWVAIAATQALATIGGTTLLATVAVGFALFNLAQLGASRMLIRHVATTTDELQAVGDVADSALGEGTRFGSNNEQLTKLLMGRHWHFAYFIAVGQDYAGMTATEAFNRFPFLKREALERIAEAYQLNCLLLDRQVDDTVFATLPPGLVSTRMLYESPRFRLLRLQWA